MCRLTFHVIVNKGTPEYCNQCISLYDQVVSWSFIYNVFVIWDTCKIRTLFLKDKKLHPYCVMYEGTCTCGERYVGETERCIHARVAEHKDTRKKSEPANHLASNEGHSFV